MSRYPAAEWVPWRYWSDTGQPTYFKGANQPAAVVLHIMQGYMSTARQWALTGHYGASWHFSVGRDGSVMQHLGFADGGYHAGIPDTAPKPAWPLWRGHGQNVNTYTIGIEHEGFSGDGFTEAQRQASKKLCQWLAMELGIPYTRDHFPPHADIDVVNRVNDFGPPAYREEHYRFMFEEDEMTKDEIEALVNQRVDAALAAQFRTLLNLAINGGVGEYTDANGNPLPYIRDEALVRAVKEHIESHPTTSPGVITITGATIKGDLA